MQKIAILNNKGEVDKRIKITEAGKMGKTVFEYDEEAGAQFFSVLERLVEKLG